MYYCNAMVDRVSGAAGAEYRNVMATVRPSRCAILIDSTSKYWRSAVRGCIERASEIWGGWGFVLVPTDGKVINEAYWKILETYSPDYIALYQVTPADMEIDDPEAYGRFEEKYRDWWAESGHGGDFDTFFSDQIKVLPIGTGPFELSDDLERTLIDRLSPFHFEGRAVRHRLSRMQGFGYPFTRVAKILPFAKRVVERVIVVGDREDPDENLLVHSMVGGATSEYIGELDAVEVKASNPFQGDEVSELLAKIARTLSPSPHGAHLDPGIAHLLESTPFGLSMTHLAQYYRADQHRPHKEPLLVVVGDTVEDFCLYYCMSRLRNRVFWLPLSWLQGCLKAVKTARKRQDSGEPFEKLSSRDGLTRSLVNLYFELINYGYYDLRIALSSLSLRRRQLVSYKRHLVECSYSGAGYAESVDLMDVDQLSTFSIGRVYEQNNFANHAAMVFVDGVSVSPFATPKPKNFNEVKLPDHYWLTSLQIDDFQPPVLPSLGVKIASINGISTDSRVAVDGIVYQCPNSMYWGSGDADTNAVRPKLTVLSDLDLLSSYFEQIGVRVGLSDKGNYVADAVKRFGGLEALGGFIRAADTRSILDKFVAKKGEEAGGIVFLSADQRAYLNLLALTNSLGSQERAIDLADELVGKQVLRRGYILQCSTCRLASWYEMRVLTDEFECNRCSFRQQYTREHWKSNGEPRWYYKLAETVHQFYRHNSHLTVQTLCNLKARSKIAFHYVPEIELWDFPSAGEKRELDIACVVDGSIFIGECKTEALRGKDASKFQKLNELFAKRPNGVVFATNLASVSDSFVATVKELENGEILVFSDLYDG